MSAPVVLIKEGIYGSAALTSAGTATWLLTMKWPGDIKNTPRQYLITLAAGQWPDGPGLTPNAVSETPNHEITVELLDHRMQGKRFSGADVCAGDLDAYPPPTVVVRFAATAPQARVLIRALTSACLDGTLWPGDPAAKDWQNRAVWLAVSRATLHYIKSGRHETGACDG